MFGLSFSELMLIGVVALIVIGPEKLPKVARTAGHLLGRAQRYVNDVKTDIRKEMDATEIGNLKDQFEEAASSVKASVDATTKTWREPLDEAQEALKQASDSVRSIADSATSSPNDATAISQSETSGSQADAESAANTTDAAGPTAQIDSKSPPDSGLPTASSATAVSVLASAAASVEQSEAHEQHAAPDEFVDTRTLPLPGFDQKQAPVAANAPAEPTPAKKGPQS